MKLTFLGALVFALIFASAEELHECARGCVAITKTKCRETDFACACADGKYMPKLLGCIGKFCNAHAVTDAHAYLFDLCRFAGSPLEFKYSTDEQGKEHVDVRAAPLPTDAPNRKAVVAPIRERQLNFTSAFTTDSVTRTTLSQDLPTASTNVTPSDPNRESGYGGASGNRGSTSSRSSRTKIGLGVGISVGIIIIVAAVSWMFLRRRKAKAEGGGAAAITGETSQHRPQWPGKEITRPAELDQSAQYVGAEMPTAMGNTAEMAATVPQGYSYQAQYGQQTSQQQQELSQHQGTQQQSQGAYQVHPQLVPQQGHGQWQPYNSASELPGNR